MKYQLNFQSLESVLGLLSELLRIRVTFFDVNGAELADNQSLPRAEFCASHRLNDAEFNEKCIACDKCHTEEAKRKKAPVIYRCHAGLLEGVVPLYNKYGLYLGSIVTGQIDEDPGREGSRKGAKAELEKIVRLIQIICTNIIEQEMIRLVRPQWAMEAEQYIQKNWNRRITFAALCKEIRKPYSQMTHAFRYEFGMPFRSYVRKYRLTQAKTLLEQGESIKETAFRCGFFDEFHFSRTFKAEFGYPPSKITK